MRISRLNMERFGPFSGKKVEGFSDALTVIHGPNEVGKSAVRAFIRSIFFGFVKGNISRTTRRLYDYGTQSGEPGAGYIKVETSSGSTYEIARRDGRNRGDVRVTGDGSGGSEYLESLLGRIGPELYQSVFSVSLTELQDFSTLESSEIRDRIYSVGLGLSSVSLPDAERSLNKELSDLRSPRSGITRKLERELNDARAELETVRSDSVRYASLAEEIGQATAAIAEKSTTLDDIRVRRERQQRLIDLRPHWERRLSLAGQVDGLPDLPNFPENAERQLDELLGQARDLRERMEDGDARQQSRTAEAQKIGVVDAFIYDADAVRRLVTETAHYRKAVEDLPAVERELHSEEAKLTRDLERLGPGWDEERVAAFSSPTDLMADLQSTGDKLNEADQEHAAAESEARRRTEEREEAAERVERENASRDAISNVPSQPAEELEERRDRLSRLRAAVADRNSLRADFRQVQMDIAETMKHAETEAIGGFIGSIWLPISIIVLGLLTVVYAVWTKELGPALPGILSVAGASILMLRAWRSGRGLKIRVRRPNVKEASEILVERRQESQARIEATTEEINAIAAEFELGEDPSPRDIEENALAMDRALSRRRAFESQDKDARDAAAHFESVDKRLQDAIAQLSLAANALEESRGAWRDVLDQASLRADLSPAQAYSVIGDIQVLKSLYVNVKRLRDRVAQMRAAIADIEARLAAVLEAAGLDSFRPLNALPALEDLARRFGDHLLAVQRRDQLMQELDEWAVQQHPLLERRLSEVEHRINSLFEQGGASDEQHFRHLARQFDERRDALRRMRELEESHPLLANEEGERYRTALESKPLEELQAKLERFIDETTRLEADLADMRTALGGLEQQRRAFEESSQATELHSRINVLEEQLREASERWAVLTVAAEMLASTKEQFQRERQPALMQAASRIFESLTLGRYESVRTVIGEDQIEVVEADGTVKGVDALSRGTAEQLYLAMRFALIEEYSRNAEPMPVIMDDVLVNFDPDRARAACAAIADLASRFQVIVLTCHPQTVAYFQESARIVAKGRAKPAIDLAVIDLAGDDSSQLTLAG